MSEGARINGATRLVGVMGWPVAHSLSPAMHNAAFAALGLNWCYAPLPVAPHQLAAAVRGLAALGFAGCNVTIPHKEAVLALLERATPAAATVGAVNTLVVEADGAIRGDNTDVYGFLRSLDEAGVALEGRTALLLGAGGAARAAAYALLTRGMDIQLLARTPARAVALAESLAGIASGGRVQAVRAAPAQVDLVVNCTPAGMWPHAEESPLPVGLHLTPATTVLDMVYRPLETRFLAQARAAGARAISGLEMLIYQGAASFEIWTGQPAPIAVLRAACLRGLGAQSS